MQIITGFDSDTSEEQEKPNAGDGYAHVIKALKHNIEVAENAFARIAKAQIRKQIEHVKRIRKDELEEVSTQGFSEDCVAFCLLDEQLYDQVAVGAVLAELVSDFGDHLLHTIKGDKVLVDSLKTRILPSRAGVYQFRLKQKWAACD